MMLKVLHRTIDANKEPWMLEHLHLLLFRLAAARDYNIFVQCFPNENVMIGL